MKNQNTTTPTKLQGASTDKYDKHHFKTKVSVQDLIQYLEELYSHGELNDFETDVYERYTYGEEITIAEWKEILSRAYTWIL